jgi:hypothetical protein
MRGLFERLSMTICLRKQAGRMPTLFKTNLFTEICFGQWKATHVALPVAWQNMKGNGLSVKIASSAMSAGMMMTAKAVLMSRPPRLEVVYDR